MEEGRAWIKNLPLVLPAACSRFEITNVGDPFDSGNVSLVFPVEAGGIDAVLKLQFVHRETFHEADALGLWNGNGAIRLLDHEPELGALLLEQCRPGHLLAADPTIDHIAVFSELLSKLLVPGGSPFTSLNDEAKIWIRSMETDWLKAGKPCDKRLMDLAISSMNELAADQTSDVLLHQDLHGHNVLAAERSPWLVIDPKPLVGDPAFSLSPIVRSAELGHSKSEALYRLDRLSEELGLDRERARLWTIGQTLAWAFGSPNPQLHFDTATWLAYG
jgi:streptomycin 6-kinase